MKQQIIYNPLFVNNNNGWRIYYINYKDKYYFSIKYNPEKELLIKEIDEDEYLRILNLNGSILSSQEFIIPKSYQ